MGFDKKVDEYERDVRAGRGSTFAGILLLLNGIGIIIMCLVCLFFFAGCMYVIWSM